ncbi:cytochrome P450 [Nocardia takedensis]|uniref:cytochrome P450 n=1 Tax=Nocardia takedensis TaxID=259390 RepID=UPI003F76E734
MSLTATRLREQNSGRNVAELGARIVIHDEHFAADPHTIYDRMRADYGAVVPVWMAPGIPATLVIGYHPAITVLNMPEQFPADPRAWQKSIPADHPMLPMVEWRPNALRSAGEEHSRYRTAINAAMNNVDLTRIRTAIRAAAAAQIDSFCGTGRVELITGYARPLVFSILNTLLGCTPGVGARIAAATARMFEGIDTDGVNEILAAALHELVVTKTYTPGNDITSHMIEYGTLEDDEICHQLFTMYAAGIEPVVNTIVNTTDKILTDPRYTSSRDRMGLGIDAAINEILVLDPPMAAHCLTYPRQPSQIDGVWVPANEPVIISMAACNRDPAVIRTIHGSDLSGNGYSGGPRGSWNLAWGSGPHACPRMAGNVGHFIVEDAITELLDRLPELAPTSDQRRWRPGPFHRAMVELELVFTPTDFQGNPLRGRAAL